MYEGGVNMNDFVELRRIISIVLKRWWLLILATVAVAALGYTVSQRQSPVYQATATLIVGQSIQATSLDRSDIQTSELLAQTYAGIARREPVLHNVVEALNLSGSWQGLKRRVGVYPVEGTQLLEIIVEASAPEEAKVIADEVANQLILQSPTALRNQEAMENQQFVRQRLESLQAKIEAAQERLEVLNASMTGSLPAEQVKEIQAEINDLEKLTADWENNYTQLLIFVETEKSPNYLAVIEPAQADPKPVRPRPRLYTLLAGMVGFLLALGLIFMLDYLDDTLKSVDDLSQDLGLASLGAIGMIKGKQYQDKLLADHDPFSPITEGYRMIRSNIQFMSVDRPIKSVVVTSASPGEGKSITVANLGLMMAQAGLKTIIVDADLRRPVQHEIFEVPNLIGVIDWLCSPKMEIKNHLRKTRVENLQLLPSGLLPPHSTEILSSQRMEQLLASLNELADVVIYDSPPVLAVADAAVLANRVDGVVMVIRAKKTRRDAVRQAMATLERAGASLLGGVLNQASKKSASYYYQGDYSPRKTSSTDQTYHRQPKRRWQGLPFFR